MSEHIYLEIPLAPPPAEGRFSLPFTAPAPGRFIYAIPGSYTQDDVDALFPLLAEVVPGCTLLYGTTTPQWTDLAVSESIRLKVDHVGDHGQRNLSIEIHFSPTVSSQPSPLALRKLYAIRTVIETLCRTK